MRILVTGSNGQLGRSLRRAFAGDPDITAQFTDYDTLDITDTDAVAAYLESNPADIIINCAAYTAVDRAESDPEAARRLNALAPGILGKAASKAGARIIHVSTDYVFNGENFKPCTELDEADPKSVYGRTKLEGESMVKAANHDAVVIRTAWLYSEFGNNFVKTMLRLGAERKEISVVADQIGTPTYAQDLADAIHAVVRNPEWHPGVYHFTDEGVASWYDFAMEIFRLAGNTDVTVHPINTAQYPTAACRPHYSVLAKDKIKSVYGIDIPYWRDSLIKCINNL
jgi:dTDP-4-dehydrorhamnose reductase